MEANVQCSCPLAWHSSAMKLSIAKALRLCVLTDEPCHNGMRAKLVITTIR